MAEHIIPQVKADWDVTPGIWGMSIDQDICTGCQACVAACAMENNISFVGETDAGYGRSLHWIRIEHTWTGEYPNVEATSVEPIMCQQCHNAPCEPVCPVFASVHSQSEDLNLQVYNRCVGTRYCANNCPYEARVFNFRDYDRPDPLPNQLNPDVTVRRRGVMEKCTFCIQRIHQSQDLATSENRDVRDGEVVPACAQACPADAIVFGRVDDPNSRVSQLAMNGRGVKLLEELGTLPHVTYQKEEKTYGRTG
jgi:Fe-S-cluster-containing dehydrogenase component